MNQAMTNSTTSPPRIDLAKKLLAYSLDPSACDGESENAAIKFIREMRRRGITLTDLADDYHDDDDGEPDELEIVMPFGQFKGQTLHAILRKNQGYLSWIAGNIKEAWLRDAAQAVLLWHVKGGK